MDITINDLQLVHLENGYVNISVVATASEGDKSLTEEFNIGRQWKGQRVVTDRRGWYLATDGKYYNPKKYVLDDPHPEWAKEPVEQNLKVEVMDVVIRTMTSKLGMNIRQDKPEVLKTILQRQHPVWDDVKLLPADVGGLVGVEKL